MDMQRYAAWKAADIRKALREGRTPTPGAPGDDLSAEGTASGTRHLLRVLHKSRTFNLQSGDSCITMKHVAC